MRDGNYVLRDKRPVLVPDLLTWAREFETMERRVKSEELPNGLWVSTVFLGIDHQFGDGPPLLFETMVFKSRKVLDEIYCERCSTWDEAEEQHRTAVTWASSPNAPLQ